MALTAAATRQTHLRLDATAASGAGHREIRAAEGHELLPRPYTTSMLIAIETTG